MTRLGPTLALLAAAGLMAACGKAEPSTSTGKRPSGTSSTARAHALALARAVNLTAADVPGFVAHTKAKDHESPGERELKAKLQACVHTVSDTPVAEVGSQQFQREAGLVTASVQSEVTVASSTSVAARELALARSKRTRDCVSRYVGLLVRAQRHPGASFGAVSLVQRIPPAPGADGSFAWRISVPITVHGVTLAIYFDIFGFVSGANEVTLFVSGVPIPPPAQVEAHLFSVLLERTRAAERGRTPSPPPVNPHVSTS
ncbi:MAG TPA: hypothetical protein VMI13_03295 [Solirubrobacteraceae bacterium]|nr:hypothetical protein [Solirubrobacteraceae bacterium]